jgi:uncharacterized protein YndB with AHSA1/START domain
MTSKTRQAKKADTMTTAPAPNPSSITYPSDTELVFTRLVNASPARVWRAYTDPVEVLKWWGPLGFRNTTHVMDVRVGGVWRLTMHAPNGVDYPNQMTYVEVNPPVRLVMDHGDFERVLFRVEIDFAEEGGKTRLSTNMIFPDKEQRDMAAVYAVEANASTTRRLEDHLASSGR